ncbi:hypothetical protein J7K06_06255 [Candidatus Bathyarchaeota archaeon]|nr:hypothetical protein [Candidatus Bathyarchaeota archaeon]
MKTFKFRIGNKTRHKVKLLSKSLILLLLAATLTLTLLHLESPLFNTNVIAYSSAFNFLFILTIFPLKGKFLNKLLTLILGNILSLIWNGLYPTLLSSTLLENILLNKFLSFINPIFNALWVISIWSLGLSMTSSPKTYAGRRT